MKYLSLGLLTLAGCATTDPHSEEAEGRKLMGLQEKFDRFDYNADGLLTRQEIEQGMRETDVVGVTPEDLDLVMQNYDVNRDGAISRWETQRAINIPLPEHP